MLRTCLCRISAFKGQEEENKPQKEREKLKKYENSMVAQYEICSLSHVFKPRLDAEPSEDSFSTII